MEPDLSNGMCMLMRYKMAVRTQVGLGLVLTLPWDEAEM